MTRTKTVPAAHKRNALTALNVSIRKPHKAVPIPHPTPKKRLFTPPEIKNGDKCLCKCLSSSKEGGGAGYFHRFSRVKIYVIYEG